VWRSGKRTEFAADAIAEQRDRLARVRIVGFEERTHVARHAGDAEQPGTLVATRRARSRRQAAYRVQ
jgi:hypothetical protein